MSKDILRVVELEFGWKASPYGRNELGRLIAVYVHTYLSSLTSEPR